MTATIDTQTSAVAEVTTIDIENNAKTWRIGGIPKICDDAMMARRAIKRHLALFGDDCVNVEVVDIHWTPKA